MGDLPEKLADHPDGVPFPGEVIARKYQVERVLAVGGMGVVVAARHRHLDQRVALKFLLPSEATQAEYAGRFLGEARAAVALRGEHVVRVLDVGTLDNGCPYMVMEYLEGRDLRAEINERGALPPSEAVGYVLQACEALAEAHALGIVHRDVKPSNLFKTRRPDGSVSIKVLDFGISKRVLGDASLDPKLTATRAVLGSPHYMSPEQVRSARTVDHRSDIWALGVTLHELVADDTPFFGDSLTALSAAIVADEPIPLRSQRPDVPEALEAIVLRCLAKHPDARFQSVGELAAALESLASGDALLSVQRTIGIARHSRPDWEPSSTANARISFADTVSVEPGVSDGRTADPVPTRDREQETLAATTDTTSSRERPLRRWLLALVAVVAALVGLGWIAITKRPEPGVGAHGEPVRLVAPPTSPPAPIVAPVTTPMPGGALPVADAEAPSPRPEARRPRAAPQRPPPKPKPTAAVKPSAAAPTAAPKPETPAPVDDPLGDRK